MPVDIIKKLIQSFFENKHSKGSQLRFREWFRLDGDQIEKDKAMQEIWEISPSAITAQTLEDLAMIKKRILNENSVKQNRLLHGQIFNYAAVIALVILSSFITYLSMKPAATKFAEFSVPFGECQKIQLSDGSVLWVNSGSTLIYPEKFNSDTRTVYLCGEANFKVAKNPNKPFIVKTNHLDVQAIGTKFSVRAYPNLAYTSATLEEGIVKVKTENYSKIDYILKPNEQLTFGNQKKKVTITKVDAAKLNSWEKGYLIFQGATFDEIVMTLERKYNVQINYQTEKYRGRSYYLKFNPSETIEQVISVLCQLVNQSNYKINKSTINIYSK